MSYKIKILLLMSLLSPSCLLSQVGIEFRLDLIPQALEEEKIEKKEEKKEHKITDNFMSKIAEKFKIEEKELQDYRAKGHGRFELIRLILISQKSNTELKKIIELRENKKIKEIAETYNLNYEEIYKEAREIKKEMEK